MRQLAQLSLLIVGAVILSGTSCVPPQGIGGKVVWVTGNQMPGPGASPAEKMPVKREIYIFEATSLDEATATEGVFFDSLRSELVAKTSSKSNGKFYVQLRPGRYSVFVKEPKGLFANQFDGNGCIRCVAVDSAEVTEITIEVNYTAAY